MKATRKLKPRKRNAGQSLVEYVLLLALVGGAAMGIFRGLNITLRQGFLKMNAELEKNLAVGNFNSKGQPAVRLYSN